METALRHACLATSYPDYGVKRFLDCIKVFPCNMQQQMCKILLNCYDKKKEIMPALAMILNRGGYIKLEHGSLKVRLRRFKNQEIDYAARRFCEELNAMALRTLILFYECT